MAKLRIYTCTSCGYSVDTDPCGHYSVISGEIYNFKCRHCREIVAVGTDALVQQKYGGPACPECGTPDGLVMWNPVEGRCPRCGGKMKVDSNAFFILVD